MIESLSGIHQIILVLVVVTVGAGFIICGSLIAIQTVPKSYIIRNILATILIISGSIFSLWAGFLAGISLGVGV